MKKINKDHKCIRCGKDCSEGYSVICQECFIDAIIKDPDDELYTWEDYEKG
jgi:NMD protein affecting ribosome stability and mRNA decay